MSGDVQVRFCERPGVKFPRATHLVILVDAHPRHAWLLKAVEHRLREGLAILAVEVNEEKTRIVDLTKGECFGFLGFDFCRVRTLTGAWRPQYTPKLKKRTALLRTLKTIFRRSRSQPVREVIQQINPIIRGWVNYFAVGHASRCFAYIHDWVERKVRRHLMRNAKRQGVGWQRWRREWLYDTLGLFDGYQVPDRRATAVPARYVS
jgi:RNA-directed DNA polymerase